MPMEFLAFHDEFVADLAADEQHRYFRSFHIIEYRRSPARSSNSANGLGRSFLMARVGVAGLCDSKSGIVASKIR